MKATSSASLGRLIRTVVVPLLVSGMFSAFCAAPCAAEDVLVLKDGKIIRGTVIDQSAGEVYIETDRVRNFSADQIRTLNGRPVAEELSIRRGRYRERMKYKNAEVRMDVYHPGTAGVPAVILLHGGGGLDDAERAARFERFATEIVYDGMVAVVLRHADANSEAAAVRQAVGFVQKLKGVDPERIGLVGYSLGGTLAISAAAEDRRIKALGICAGYMPAGMTQGKAKRLPPTFFETGDKDPALQTLKKLEAWAKANGTEFESSVNEGGHEMTIEELFRRWQYIRRFMKRTLLRPDAKR